MKNISSIGRLAGLGVIAMIAAAGCGNGNANNDAAVDTAGTVDSAVNAAGRAVDGAADTAGNVVANADDAAAGAANSVAGAAKNADDALIQTPKVKTAILNNAGMKGAQNLNVTSSDKNVTLTGTVKTQAQKTLAGAIAKKNSPGYNVVNNLKVSK